MTDLINQLMSDRGVCRTAPATPGLLNTCRHVPFSVSFQLSEIRLQCLMYAIEMFIAITIRITTLKYLQDQGLDFLVFALIRD